MWSLIHPNSVTTLSRSVLKGYQNFNFLGLSWISFSIYFGYCFPSLQIQSLRKWLFHWNPFRFRQNIYHLYFRIKIHLNSSLEFLFREDAEVYFQWKEAEILILLYFTELTHIHSLIFDSLSIYFLYPSWWFLSP